MPKGLPINHLGKLDGRKGVNLGLWMVAKALRSGHPQKVAFPLYLAILRKAHCRAELVSPAENGGRVEKAQCLDYSVLWCWGDMQRRGKPIRMRSSASEYGKVWIYEQSIDKTT